MPKYYIQDGVEKTIISADNGLQACFRAIRYKFDGIPVNGFYVVSEQGYENHSDDIVFSSEEVIQGFLDMLDTRREEKKKLNDIDDAYEDLGEEE